MFERLCPKDRYMITRGGRPVFTTNDIRLIVPFLWGSDIKKGYVVFDWEHPYRVDNSDLLEWIKPLEEAS